MSGNLRTYKKCYNNFFLNIVNVLKQKYEVNIFMHLWDSETDTDKKESLDIYNPKKYVIDKDNDFKIPNYCSKLLFRKKGRDEKYSVGINQKLGVYRAVRTPSSSFII